MSSLCYKQLACHCPISFGNELGGGAHTCPHKAHFAKELWSHSRESHAIQPAIQPSEHFKIYLFLLVFFPPDPSLLCSRLVGFWASGVLGWGRGWLLESVYSVGFSLINRVLWVNRIKIMRLPSSRVFFCTCRDGVEILMRFGVGSELKCFPMLVYFKMVIGGCVYWMDHKFSAWDTISIKK